MSTEDQNEVDEYLNKYADTKKYYQIDDITCPFDFPPRCEGRVVRHLTTGGKWIMLNIFNGDYLGYLGEDPNGRKANFVPQEKRWKNQKPKTTTQEYGEEDTQEFSPEEADFRKSLSSISAQFNDFQEQHIYNQTQADNFSKSKKPKK